MLFVIDCSDIHVHRAFSLWSTLTGHRPGVPAMDVDNGPGDSRVGGEVRGNAEVEGGAGKMLKRCKRRKRSECLVPWARDVDKESKV
jgi:hypothetical protein